MAKFEPLLSAKIFSSKPGETEKHLGMLKFPLWGSIKYDGIRIIDYQGEMHTRSLKIMRNTHARGILKGLIEAARLHSIRGLDGEIIAGEVADPNAMQNTTSGIMNYGRSEDFTFLLFDAYHCRGERFRDRYAHLLEFYQKTREMFPFVHFVEQRPLHSLEEVFQYEKEMLELGYEGIMLRDPDGLYKFGRSSMREGILMALKRFVDDEALILEMLPELENTNPAEENELGRTKRSGHQENLIPKDRMGTMICRSPRFEKTFRLGGGRGITHDVRKEMWDNWRDYVLTPAKYTYQDIGVKERPRLPKWAGRRSFDDMGIHDAELLRSMAEGYVPTGRGRTLL